jgi:hypothetical protein
MQPEAPTVQQFVTLESQVWEAFVAGDAQADARVLADNFIGVYSTGFSNRAEHCSALRNGPIAQRYEIQDPRILVLSDSLVMLMYLAVWERANSAPGRVPKKMYISSLWQNADGHWKNVFSQDTKAE